MKTLIVLASVLLSLSVNPNQATSTPIEIRDGLAISGVIAGGRLPVFFDSVQDQIVHGKWSMPKEGDTCPTASGGSSKWHHVAAGKDGSFGGLGNGYLVATVDLGEDQTLILNAAGHSLVYVNGVPRGGDPYSYGYLHLPVNFHRGQNTLLFTVGRGSLRASLTAPKGSVQIEMGDLTTPDILVGGPKEVWAGVVVLNNTDKSKTYRVTTTNSMGVAVSGAAVVPAMSLRKVPVKLLVPEGPLGAEQKFQIAVDDGKASDHSTLTLSVKKPNETHRETFISDIDGSLQYYGVNPSQKPSKSDALILSLHGASVEGIGQAAAYSNKDWCTLVAPTNRRPYGFDWEDIGRLDAMEVLDIAKKKFVHDPSSVHLTGHSMGGHGTWSIGTLYPDTFATIAPSAGWISFWTYAGGYKPRNASPVESLLTQAMSPSDTLARVNNTLEEKTYIVHGDADDNVPVEEARTMKKVLTDIHASFEYHEQPGAGHWWGLPNKGAACVDWPGIFDQIKSTKLTVRDSINFTTPSPAVSSHDEWVTVLEQVHAMVPSTVKIDATVGTTTNVAALQLDRAFNALTLDNQELGKVAKGSVLVQTNGKWQFGHLADGAKSPSNSGPFKNVYRNRFIFVVGTHGSPEENKWASDKARFDAETFEYRGNGSVEIVEDRNYRSSWQRNVILYGNADTNSAWKSLLGSCPIQVTNNTFKVGDQILKGADLAGLFVYPHKARGQWVMVGAITGTGMEGFRTTDRLAIFTSGVAYPDWTVMSADAPRLGAKAVKGCGFFGNDWSLQSGESAWNK